MMTSRNKGYTARDSAFISGGGTTRDAQTAVMSKRRNGVRNSTVVTSFQISDTVTMARDLNILQSIECMKALVEPPCKYVGQSKMFVPCPKTNYSLSNVNAFGRSSQTRYFPKPGFVNRRKLLQNIT